MGNRIIGRKGTKSRANGTRSGRSDDVINWKRAEVQSRGQNVRRMTRRQIENEEKQGGNMRLEETVPTFDTFAFSNLNFNEKAHVRLTYRPSAVSHVCATTQTVLFR